LRPLTRVHAILIILVVFAGFAPVTAAAQQHASQPTGEPDYAIQLIYAVPRNGVDRNLDNDGTIENLVASAQEWLKGETGGRSLNVVGGAESPTIEFFELSRTEQELENLPDEEISYQIEYEARAEGYDAPGVINAIFFEGTEPDGMTCGAAPSPDDAPANSATLFLQSDCQVFPFADPGDPADFWELTFMHEIFHELGAVLDCAPNADAGHVDDPHDLMYGGETDWDYPVRLDVDHDDYYGTGRNACYDTARSPYLIPNEAETEPFPTAFQDLETGSCALSADPQDTAPANAEVWMINISENPVDIYWQGGDSASDRELIDTIDPWSGIVYTSVPGDTFFLYGDDGTCLGSFVFPDFIDIGVVWISP
jgi:hypothetical protein